MKYMTFRNSCVFASIANILESYDLDFSDREVIKEMGNPYIFIKEKNTYKTGPMLQEKLWFQLFLNKYNLIAIEKNVRKDEIIELLERTNNSKDIVLGIKLDFGKHAVILKEVKREVKKDVNNQDYRIEKRYIFLNNRHEDEKVNNYFEFSKEELLDKLDDYVSYFYIKRKTITQEKLYENKLFLINKLENSLNVLEELKTEIFKLCYNKLYASEIKISLDTLFRPLLLDGVEMLSILGEDLLKNNFIDIRNNLFLSFKNESSYFLKDYIDLNLLDESIEMYKDLIKKRLENIK